MEVLDAQAVVVPRASNRIDFAIEGPGTIVGVDNGDATSHESRQVTSRSAFSGKALVIVQATSDPGQIVLSATSNGRTSSPPVATPPADQSDKHSDPEP